MKFHSEVCPMCGQALVNPVTLPAAVPTGEKCQRITQVDISGDIYRCNKPIMDDGYCEAGHSQPVRRPLDKRDFPLGGDFDA